MMTKHGHTVLVGAADRKCMMCCQTGYARRYYTNEEKRQWLQGYAEELENELKGVKERIRELGGEA